MAVFTAIGLFVQQVAFSVGFSAASAVLIGAGAVSVTRSLALSLFINAITPTASIPKAQIRATINQSTGPRTKLYGQGLLGGTRALWEVSGNELYQIIVMNDGELEENISFWMDGRPVDVVGGEVTDDIYNGNVKIAWLNGSGVGGDYPDVTSEFPTVWTSSHELNGQATARAIFTAADAASFNKSFPKGANTDVQIEAKGSLVYDSRTLNTAYSDNSGLVITDYLNKFWDIPLDKFDTDLCNEFYDLCDVDITKRAGGTRKQYRAWGVVSYTAEPKSELARLLQTCSANVYQTAEGKVAFIGGKYVAPDVTITGDDIMQFKLSEGAPKLDAFNVVRGVYTSIDHSYQDAEAQPWEDETLLLTQPEKSYDFVADMVPDHGQMRQLMKLEYHRKNRPFLLSITTNLVGIKARFPKGIGYHVIRVVNDEMDFDEVCEVLTHDLYAEPDENGVLQWRCVMELAGIDPAWNDWDPILEEGVAPIAPLDLEVEGIPVPTIVLLEQFTDGGNPAIGVEIADDNRPDLEFIGRIRVSPNGDWKGMTEADLRAEKPNRTVGETYDVRVKYVGGAFSSPVSITIT